MIKTKLKPGSFTFFEFEYSVDPSSDSHKFSNSTFALDKINGKKIPFKPKYTQFSTTYFNRNLTKIDCLLLSVDVLAKREGGWNPITNKILSTPNKELVCTFKFLTFGKNHVCLMIIVVSEPEISNFLSFMLKTP
jgi:hypothetical protein